MNKEILKNKKNIVVISLISLIVITITLALIFKNSNSIRNSFEPMYGQENMKTDKDVVLDDSKINDFIGENEIHKIRETSNYDFYPYYDTQGASPDFLNTYYGTLILNKEFKLDPNNKRLEKTIGYTIVNASNPSVLVSHSLSLINDCNTYRNMTVAIIGEYYIKRPYIFNLSENDKVKLKSIVQTCDK